MKLFFKKSLQKKTSGFSLIEVIISIFLISIIMLSVVNIIFITKRIEKNIIENNTVALDIDFAIEYIFNEVDRSHYILLDNNIQNDWLGFVLITDNSKKKVPYNERFSYTTYLLKGQNLYRGNYKYNSLSNKFDIRSFHTPNIILKNIKNFKGEYDTENNRIKLTLKDKQNKVYIYFYESDSILYE